MEKVLVVLLSFYYIAHSWPIYTIDIGISTNNWNNLYNNPNSDTRYPCTLTFLGVVYPNLTICNHGGFSRSLPKRSYELRWYDTYPHLNLFQYPGDSSFKVKSILIGSSAIDPTFIRQKLLSDTILDLGGFAPRMVWSEVYINSDYYGFYLFEERINDDYLKDRGWNKDGNLYKSTTHSGNFKLKQPPTTGYAQPNGDPATNGDVGDLLDIINNTPHNFADYEESVNAIASITDWFIYNLIHLYAYDQDAFDKNYYMYHNPNITNPFRFISWDMDSTWGNNWYGNVLNPPNDLCGWDQFSQLLLGNSPIPEYFQSYILNMECLINEGLLQPSVLITKLTSWYDDIKSYIAKDQAVWVPIYKNNFGGQPYDPRTPDIQVQNMTSYINNRGTWLLSKLLPKKTNSPDVVLDQWGLPRVVCGYIRELHIQPSNLTILINEVYTGDSTKKSTGWVELYNPMGESVNISGWFISNDINNKTKVKLPSGIVMASGGYYTVDVDFLYSIAEQLVYLYSDYGELIYTLDVPPSLPGDSYGLWQLTTGEYDTTFLSLSTKGSKNEYPRVGPLVITEISYDVPIGHLEYMVIQSIVSTPTSLYMDTFNWEVKGIDFSFPSETVIPANGVALILVGNSSLLQYIPQYPTKPGVQIFNAETGKISNDGESLQIKQYIAASDDMDSPVDRVVFGVTDPWPIIVVGQTLVRTSTQSYSNDPESWKISSSCNPSWQVCPTPTPTPTPTIAPTTPIVNPTSGGSTPSGSTPSVTPGGSTPSATPGGSTPSATPSGSTPSVTPGGSTPSATPSGSTPSVNPTSGGSPSSTTPSTSGNPPSLSPPQNSSQINSNNVGVLDVPYWGWIIVACGSALIIIGIIVLIFTQVVNKSEVV